MHKKNKQNQTVKLSWWNLTKKYWKEQIVFYILTTSSCIMAAIIDHNSISGLWEAISENKWSPSFKVFDKVIIDKFSSVQSFLIFMGVLVITYCLIVIAHVYFAYWLSNKISRHLKKKLIKKLFQCQGAYDKETTLTIFNQDARVFTYNVMFVPNQLYYVFLSTTFAFYFVRKAGGGVVWLGLSYLTLILTVILFLDWFLYKRDLQLRKVSEEETKKEDIAVNNRDLIIKKGETISFQSAYGKTVARTNGFANKRDLTYTLSWVVPSFSLVTYADFIFLPLVYGKGVHALTAMKMFGKVFSGAKKMIERLRDYPYYFSAKKRLNKFLAKKERNDLQKNILVSEPIENISLEKVSFAYQENKPVLKKINLVFQRGKINHLTGENGFGKSTIISLLMGLYQPKQGEIIVNNKYKLNEINLKEWRKKIAYAEHQNLIENGLSTGQKQLTDLSNLFANSEDKEVIILDEADNALDENNKKKIREKISKISQNKLVILISH